MTKDYAARDKAIRTFGKGLIGPLRSEMTNLKIKNYSGKMRSGLRDRYWSYHGRITALAYAMPRHAVFVHKGVGRGYPIESVSGMAMGQVRSKKAKALLDLGHNKRAIANHLSIAGKLGASNRKPKPWFNPVIKDALPKLANELAKHDADLVARNVFIL